MSKLTIGTLVELPPWEHEFGRIFGLGDVCMGVVCNVKKIAMAGEVYEVLVNGELRIFHRDDLKVWEDGKKKKEKIRTEKA